MSAASSSESKPNCSDAKTDASLSSSAESSAARTAGSAEKPQSKSADAKSDSSGAQAAAIPAVFAPPGKYQKRKKFEHQGRTVYEWEQDIEEASAHLAASCDLSDWLLQVNIWVPLPKGLP